MDLDPATKPSASTESASPSRVIALDDERALDPRVSGGKAAALARARRGGVGTMSGAIITTAVSDLVDSGASIADVEEIAEIVSVIAPDGRPMVVRSSSVVEDQAASSQAGQFETVLDVCGVDELFDATRVVLDSRARAEASDQPIAVLVQPMADPEVAGVFFGVDPVTGRSDRRVVAAVRGQSDPLVSGEVDGSRWLLDARGHVVEHDIVDGLNLTPSRLREIVALGDRVAEVFGYAQDVEWAVVDGELLLFQSRPVTTEIRGVPSGPVFGPGPVAETFPEPLTQLEIDLWVPPLRRGVREALRLSGSGPEKALQGRELVTVVDGRVALDLEITGDYDGPTSVHRAGLSARVRRLRSAWRVGRLRLALPLIADDLARQVDEDLEQVPDLGALSTRQLVALIGRGRYGLVSLHAHEILMGMVMEPSDAGFTGASVALRVLAESRVEGYTDEEILRRSPLVLALVAPRVGSAIVLPSSATASELTYDAPEVDVPAVQRETLRLRTRWMQELVGQAAFEVGCRLASQGVLADPMHVRHLHFDELAEIVAHRAVPDLERLVAAERASQRPGSGLPARFQVSDRGHAIALTCEGGSSGGTGAGGGIGRGPVTYDTENPPPGSVLVVTTLTPQLGPLLHHLKGIVAETGSVLSHLAILARERGVATVVAYPGATQLVEGTLVTVNGHNGEVTIESSDDVTPDQTQPLSQQEAPS